jgi:hypothetical protein
VGNVGAALRDSEARPERSEEQSRLRDGPFTRHRCRHREGIRTRRRERRRTRSRHRGARFCASRHRSGRWTALKSTKSRSRAAPYRPRRFGWTSARTASSFKTPSSRDSYPVRGVESKRRRECSPRNMSAMDEVRGSCAYHSSNCSDQIRRIGETGEICRLRCRRALIISRKRAARVAKGC